jgi:hypothetical protein
MATAAVRVGRLTVYPGVGSGRDVPDVRDVAARLRAESLLGSLDLVPPGLGDRAVLVVRQVRWHADRQLPQAARSTVEAMWRAASRAGVEAPTNPDAPAVIFADEAELLACLTHDALRGGLDRWYWQRLAPSRAGGVGAVLTAAWTAHIRWLPAALAALPATEAARAVATLSRDQAGYVRRVLLSEYAVAGYEGVGYGARWQGPAVRERRAGAPVGIAAPSAGENDDGLTPIPPRQIGGERSSARGIKGGLSSAREIADGRSSALATTSSPWSAREISCGSAPVPPWRPWLPATVATAAALTPANETLLGIALALHAAPAAVRRAGFGRQVDVWLDMAAQPRLPQASAVGTAPTTTDPVPPHEPPYAASPGPVPPDGGPPRDRAAAVPEPVEPAGTEPGNADRGGGARARGVLSQAASALFLINMLTWLELPAEGPDGTAPSGWAIVELLARYLLDPDTVPDDDPLWTVLAELDGREPGTVARDERGGLLTIADPAWAAVCRFVAASLASREISVAVLAQPGRIVITRTHVDVVLDLDRVDLAARTSGLDRDPGWVPDLGRVVAFHFEAGA